MVRTLVLGVGNPLRGDDGVGPAVAEEVCRRLNGAADYRLFAGSGLDLLGCLGAYECVAIIDGLEGGALPVGECGRIEWSDEFTRKPAAGSSHETGVLEALKLARSLKITLPRDLRFYGIGIRTSEGFKEGLSDPIGRRVSAIALEIAGDLSPVVQGEETTI